MLEPDKNHTDKLLLQVILTKCHSSVQATELIGVHSFPQLKFYPHDCKTATFTTTSRVHKLKRGVGTEHNRSI